MTRKILINALDPEENRIAAVFENKLDQFHIETSAKEVTKGNIYKGIVTRVEQSLQAVFVDYGGNKNGFLQKNEIHPDYFQDVEKKDKSLFNLIKKGQELIVQVTKDPIMKKGAMLTTNLSLPGRYMVLMPFTDHIGISQRIEDEAERDRLKTLIDDVRQAQGIQDSRRLSAPPGRVHAGQHQGQFHVLQRAGAGQQIEVLKDEPDSLVTEVSPLIHR